MAARRLWGNGVGAGSAALAAVCAASLVGAASSPPPVVTFNKDVLPILQKNCQSCHRPGQVAPFSLLDYRSARPWARAIKLKVTAREMPPWFADAEDGHFVNDRRLKPSDIDTLTRWVDEGAVEGDPNDAPPPVTWPADGWEIQPDIVVNGPEYHVPARGVVEWINVTVPSGLTKDTWITSFEVRPSEPSVTHHICVAFKPHTPDVVYNVPEWADKKRDENGLEPPRHKGQSTPRKTQRTGSTNEGCFLPGSAVTDYRPFNAAKLIPAGTDLVFTMHYSPNGKETIDRPRVGWTVAKTPPQKRWITYPLTSPTDADSFAIPPNDPNWESPPADVTFAEDVQLVWMSPHMHVRGKDMIYRAIFPDGHSEVVLNVPKYDFNWQLGYLLANPVELPKGTKLHVVAHYNNSASNKANPNPNQTVYYGDMTWEEMMTPFTAVLVDMKVDPKKVLAPGSQLSPGGGVG